MICWIKGKLKLAAFDIENYHVMYVTCYIIESDLYRIHRSNMA